MSKPFEFILFATHMSPQIITGDDGFRADREAGRNTVTTRDFVALVCTGFQGESKNSLLHSGLVRRRSVASGCSHQAYICCTELLLGAEGSARWPHGEVPRRQPESARHRQTVSNVSDPGGWSAPQVQEQRLVSVPWRQRADAACRHLVPCML